MEAQPPCFNKIMEHGKLRLNQEKLFTYWFQLKKSHLHFKVVLLDRY